MPPMLEERQSSQHLPTPSIACDLATDSEPEPQDDNNLPLLSSSASPFLLHDLEPVAQAL